MQSVRVRWRAASRVVVVCASHVWFVGACAHASQGRGQKRRQTGLVAGSRRSTKRRGWERKNVRCSRAVCRRWSTFARPFGRVCLSFFTRLIVGRELLKEGYSCGNEKKRKRGNRKLSRKKIKGKLERETRGDEEDRLMERKSVYNYILPYFLRC